MVLEVADLLLDWDIDSISVIVEVISWVVDLDRLDTGLLRELFPTLQAVERAPDRAVLVFNWH